MERDTLTGTEATRCIEVTNLRLVIFVIAAHTRVSRPLISDALFVTLRLDAS